jgi:hypothetical protein
MTPDEQEAADYIAAWGLTWRQTRLYTFRCDIYRPLKAIRLDVDATGKDLDYPPLPTAKNVPCYRKDSQEFNNPTPIGRGKGDLVMTNTSFTFPLKADVGEGYLIRFHLLDALAPGEREADARQLTYRFYIVQGDPSDTPTVRVRHVNSRNLVAAETQRPLSVLE